MNTGKYEIQISLVTLKYYHKCSGIWKDYIALPHWLGVDSRIAHKYRYLG